MPKVSESALAARRSQILAGARVTFARHGYEGATVRLLEIEIGLSRGAIFHHFRDKESLFLSLAAEDFAEMASIVAERGLVQVMRELPARDPDWLGTWLEVSRRLRTDPIFRESWSARTSTLTETARTRLARGRDSGALRDDVDLDILLDFLLLVLDGLILHRAMGVPIADLDAVLDLVEETVRRAPVRSVD